MGLSILLVDDDFINRKLLTIRLKKYQGGVEITEAENGSDALVKLKQDPSINIILLDIIMPIVDGIEFLKIFRSDSKNSNIPVIAISTDDARKAEVFNNGANDFLQKPINEEKLYEKIGQWTS